MSYWAKYKHLILSSHKKKKKCVVIESKPEEKVNGILKKETDCHETRKENCNTAVINDQHCVKKVRFAPEEQVCYLYDDDDHRQARCGEWEEMARDRSRFKSRICSTAEVIAPILSQEHRRKIFKSRFS